MLLRPGFSGKKPVHQFPTLRWPEAAISGVHPKAIFSPVSRTHDHFPACHKPLINRRPAFPPLPAADVTTMSLTNDAAAVKMEEALTKDEVNLKLINTTSGIRVSQACDRCRIKKIKCDGLTPCVNCKKISFDCRTSDKLTRRAFPKGYTENLEKKLKELEEEVAVLRQQNQRLPRERQRNEPPPSAKGLHRSLVTLQTPNTTVQINNPIDQIFNLDKKGIIIGNDNLNFELQFNHLLINLNLPFLKITNSHNYLLNDPNSYLYHPSFTSYNRFHNRDLDFIFNPLTINNPQNDDMLSSELVSHNAQLPRDIYDLFIKLINNFKKLFNNKRELDNQVIQFFLNYNVFIPIFDFKQFMESYDAFHTMYPFMFTYDDATINGFNILNNDYHVVNEYLMVVIQIYAMILMNDPTVNLNLLLNHPEPSYAFLRKQGLTRASSESLVRSLYDFLPYFNVFHLSITQLQTYLLFLYYSLLTNNKEKSLVLMSLVNSFIGILGINLNSKNLFFNDLSLTLQQKRNRVKIFWVFKVLLKCFNLKFGFKPSLNTTVINPVTIERYFQLTPEKLSSLLEVQDGELDGLFRTMLKPSVEFLNLMNIIIPSSFSPNYYQYLKNDRQGGDSSTPHNKKGHAKHLDWILNDDDGDGNDGNLNYNYTQFLTIDKNLSNWRYSLKDKEMDLLPLQSQMNLPVVSGVTTNTLYHKITMENFLSSSGISNEGLVNYLNSGLPDIHTASQLIKIQLNFHYLLIRSMNYLNFVVDRELTQSYYGKIANISREVLAYFLLIFGHVGESAETWEYNVGSSRSGTSYTDSKAKTAPNNVILESLGLDVDEDGFVINDFSVKRRRTSSSFGNKSKNKTLIKNIPPSPFNYMLNGLSMTIINFKKSIVLQMLYLLICCMKSFKKESVLMTDSIQILMSAVNLFLKVFINYQVGTGSPLNKGKKSKEDELFNKLIKDELRDELLVEHKNNVSEESDDENDLDDNGDLHSDIDWDDEEMDEDLKYLKVLKFIQYKAELLKKTGLTKQKRSTSASSNIPNPSEVTHHHHHRNSSSSIGGNIKPIPAPQAPNMEYRPTGGPSQPVTMNYYQAGHQSPGPLGQAGFPFMLKMPSISKFDFLLSEENFLHSPITSPSTFSYPPPGEEMSPAKPKLYKIEDEQLVTKEKSAVNDLMTLKHGHKTAYGGSWDKFGQNADGQGQGLGPNTATANDAE